jgi:uncharacterized protein YbjT (DUF2867 family)
VELNGNLNLIEAAKRLPACRRFVLVSSIGADDLVNPLNLFWGVLIFKKQAELALARSGLAFTVVRPGGLKSALRPGEAEAGQVVMAPAGTYGFPPLKKSGSILRSQVRRRRGLHARARGGGPAKGWLGLACGRPTQRSGRGTAAALDLVPELPRYTPPQSSEPVGTAGRPQGRACSLPCPSSAPAGGGRVRGGAGV